MPCALYRRYVSTETVRTLAVLDSVRLLTRHNGDDNYYRQGGRAMHHRARAARPFLLMERGA
jgi:hypothetical protein